MRAFLCFYFSGRVKETRQTIGREDHACRFFQVIMAKRSHFVVDLINGRAEWRSRCVGIGSLRVRYQNNPDKKDPLVPMIILNSRDDTNSTV